MVSNAPIAIICEFPFFRAKSRLTIRLDLCFDEIPYEERLLRTSLHLCLICQFGRAFGRYVDRIGFRVVVGYWDCLIVAETRPFSFAFPAGVLLLCYRWEMIFVAIMIKLM